ncbi:MAG: prenyltransferase/squalene oxidase repeat-containing protein [Thermogutta sp.]
MTPSAPQPFQNPRSPGGPESQEQLRNSPVPPSGASPDQTSRIVQQTSPGAAPLASNVNPGIGSPARPVPIPVTPPGTSITHPGVVTPQAGAPAHAAFPRTGVKRSVAPGRGGQPPDRENDQTEDLGDTLVYYAQPWLISAIVHMILLIILALIVIPQFFHREVDLTAEIYAEKLGDQLEFDSPFAGNDPEKVEEPLLTPPDLNRVENPFAAPPPAEIIPEGVTSTSDLQATVIGYALKGRDEGAKEALLAAYGGTATTEAAVALGLAWLARQQRKDGSWSLVGPYPNGAQDENPEAATAMALLAFQGAGITHKRGKFRENVARGWDWLLQQQDADGNFFHEGAFNHRFYTQGQCTIALCEIYGMTRDDRFREPALRAVDYLIRSQSSEGGWRYSPNADSDVSVTGWIVMALQSARMAGLEVPADVFRKVTRFLDRIALEGGSKYPYQKGREATLAMTAEALLMRQFLGWSRDDDRLIKGVTWITEPANLINFERDRDVYYWYYATQVCHHMEGDYWKKWNSVMRQLLPENQVKTGREAGSWDPLKPSRDAWANEGGRLYVTCLSIYCLEVYYRHLPLYSSGAIRLISSTSPAPPAAAPSQPATPSQ